MTSDDLQGFEPGLVQALVNMEKASLGPMFDLTDVRAVAGLDPKLILGPFASACITSADSATTEAMVKLQKIIKDVRCASGIFAHVVVGPEAAASRSVRTVADLLRSKAADDVGLICGCCIDPALGSNVKVVLWAR